MNENLIQYGTTSSKDYQFNVDIEFNTRIDLTPRIIQISEAFGLGVSEEKKFAIFKNFRIGFSKGDVVFVTGDSGGGKSLLLKEIRKKLAEKGEKVVGFEDIIVNDEDVIIESIGKTTEEAVYYLSLMGLNDAFIFLRKYKHLSDGQKYRFKLAKMLETQATFLFIDELCACLDRITAKVIVYNLQKIIRRNKCVLFSATTHTDLVNDLQPSVLVIKKFMDEVEIDYPIIELNKKISFYNDIRIERGSIEDYKKLSKYHYRNTTANFPYTSVFVAKYDGELVGVTVFSPPFLQTKGRTIKFEKKYSLMTKEVVSEINKLFIRLSRHVVSPKFRGCGLGQKLALESMKSIKDKKYIETISVMGKFNPVFEKVGMEKIEITEESDSATLKLDRWLKEKGLRIEEISNPSYFKSFVIGLSSDDKNELKLLTGKVLHHPKIGLSSKDGKRAEVVAQEKRYKEVSYEEVENEILSYIPKLYYGITIYYVWKNSEYKENVVKTLGDFQ